MASGTSGNVVFAAQIEAITPSVRQEPPQKDES